MVTEMATWQRIKAVCRNSPKDSYDRDQAAARSECLDRAMLAKKVIGGKVRTWRTSCKELSLNMHPGSVETSALAERLLSAYGQQVVKNLMAFRLSAALLSDLAILVLVFKAVTEVVEQRRDRESH
jgi:hypothetical protein